MCILFLHFIILISIFLQRSYGVYDANVTKLSFCEPEFFVLTQLTYYDRKQILQFHNNLRNDIALGECLDNNSTYLPAQWAESLQYISELWALQCIVNNTESFLKLPDYNCAIDNSYGIEDITTLAIPINNFSAINNNSIDQRNFEQRWENIRLRTFLQIIHDTIKFIGCVELALVSRNWKTTQYLICSYKPGKAFGDYTNKNWSNMHSKSKRSNRLIEILENQRMEYHMISKMERLALRNEMRDGDDCVCTEKVKVRSQKSGASNVVINVYIIIYIIILHLL